MSRAVESGLARAVVVAFVLVVLLVIAVRIGAAFQPISGALK